MKIEIPERYLRLARSGGWIGVDLDGTMFTYTHWVGWNVFGEPIRPMIDRVLAWHEAGILVKIVTARVGLPVMASADETANFENIYSREFTGKCRVTRMNFSDHMMAEAVRDHCERHGLPRLPVQCFKDADMIEQWDDRAVQVIINTGMTLRESCARAIIPCGECDCPELSRKKILEIE